MFNHENLKGRVAVVTGGGGVLCGGFAKTLAAQGCKVAVLDLNEAAAQAVADEINANGGQAIAVGCNVLEPASMRAARDVVAEKLGTCDILLNGAGGNNPKGTTTKETLEKIDLAQQDPEVKTFFDLDPQGISFVFNLNFLGSDPHADLCQGYGREGQGLHCDGYLYECVSSADQNSGVQRC